MEFDSDVDHREMTRSYASEDYLARWLPNIQRKKDEPRSSGDGMNEKQIEKQGRRSLSRDNKVRHATKEEPTKKTYFEAIKCSPMKLRNSIAVLKRPKLDERCNFQAERKEKKETNQINNNNETLPSATVVANLTTFSKYEEEKHSPEKGEKMSSKNKTSPCIVEVQSDSAGHLGSLSFRKNGSESYHSDDCYILPNMIGGKLRRVRRQPNNRLLTGRNKNSELLVRCESIMIYPKILSAQRLQSERYGGRGKPEKPKQAWEDGVQSSLSSTSHHETNVTILPNSSPTIPDAGDQDLASENQDILPNSKSPQSKDPQVLHSIPSAKIIIPFGEDEFSASLANLDEKLPPRQKEERAKLLRYSVWESKLSSDMRKNGRPRNSNEPAMTERSWNDEFASNNARRILHVTQLEMSHKTPIATQYFTVSSHSFPLKKFRIPPGDENTKLHVGHEALQPKISSSRFSYRQRGENLLPEFGCVNSLAETNTDNKGQGQKENIPLKIGGKALLREKLGREDPKQGKLVDDESGKRVKFFVPKSRYYTRE